MIEKPEPEDLGSLIETAEELTSDLRDLRGAIGATALGQLDRLMRYRLMHLALSLRGVAGRIEVMAGQAWPAPEHMPPRPTEEELYERLLGPEYYYRQIYQHFDTPPHMIVITSDSTLVVDGTTVALSREGVYIFNKLLMQQTGYPTRFFAERFMRDGESFAEAQKRARTILFSLKQTMGEDVLYQTSIQNRAFRLSDNIILIDNRPPVTVQETAEPQEVNVDQVEVLPESTEEFTVQTWEDVRFIAEHAEVELGSAEAFVVLYRHKMPHPPKMIRRRTEQHGSVISEHYHPTFVVWAIRRLRQANAEIATRMRKKP